MRYLVTKSEPVYVVSDKSISYRLKFARDQKFELLDYVKSPDRELTEFVTAEQLQDPDFWKPSDRFLTLTGIAEFLNKQEDA